MGLARRARTRTSPPPRAPLAPPANTPTANTPASATRPAARLKTRGASPSWTVESCTFTAKCCGGDASFTFLLLCDHLFGRTNKQKSFFRERLFSDPCTAVVVIDIIYLYISCYLHSRPFLFCCCRSRF